MKDNSGARFRVIAAATSERSRGDSLRNALSTSAAGRSAGMTTCTSRRPQSSAGETSSRLAKTMTLFGAFHFAMAMLLRPVLHSGQPTGICASLFVGDCAVFDRGQVSVLHAKSARHCLYRDTEGEASCTQVEGSWSSSHRQFSLGMGQPWCAVP